MSDTEVPQGEVVSYPVDSMEPMSFEDAVRDLGAARDKALNPTAESAPTATADTELPDEGNAAPAEEQATGETEEADPAEMPPLDLPRSWTKEQAEHWSALPRATQEYLAAQDSKASAEVRRVQNEAAEARKAAQAERDQAEKARQQYEAQLPALMRELESVNQASFSDIKTMEDVVRLQAEDPFRFQGWQVHQMRLQSAKQESDRVTQEKAVAEQSNWAKHVQEENARAAEFIPDLADKAKSETLTKRVATELLPELGFKDSELADLANGRSKLSIYDHRIQRLLADGLKLRDIQNAPKAVAAKPLPTVQRPGTSKPAGANVASQIQALEKQLSSASGDRAARISADIWRLEKKAASR